MRSIIRYLAVAALVGSSFMLWRAHTAQDVVVAQTRKPIMVMRIYTGTDGLSHAQQIEMKLTGGQPVTLAEPAIALGPEVRPRLRDREVDVEDHRFEHCLLHHLPTIASRSDQTRRHPRCVPQP